MPIKNIIDSSSVDGDGNRTAIFFQGCNFNCTYCHNPETIHLCVHCGACVGQCPTGALHKEGDKVVWNQALCIACETCEKVCPHDSSPRVQWTSVEKLAARLGRNRPFIRGITCSGGECTLYADFMEELFREAKGMGLTCYIDSNGNFDFLARPALLDLCDGVMLDVKCADPEKHRILTDADNGQMLRSLVELARAGKLLEVRTVIIPEVLPNEETISTVAALLAPHLGEQSIRYKLIAYRPFGVREAYNDYPTPDATYLETLRQLALEKGFGDVVVL